MDNLSRLTRVGQVLLVSTIGCILIWSTDHVFAEKVRIYILLLWLIHGLIIGHLVRKILSERPSEKESESAEVAEVEIRRQRRPVRAHTLAE